MINDFSYLQSLFLQNYLLELVYSTLIFYVFCFCATLLNSWYIWVSKNELMQYQLFIFWLGAAAENVVKCVANAVATKQQPLQSSLDSFLWFFSYTKNQCELKQIEVHRNEMAFSRGLRMPELPRHHQDWLTKQQINHLVAWWLTSSSTFAIDKVYRDYRALRCQSQHVQINSYFQFLWGADVYCALNDWAWSTHWQTRRPLIKTW